MDGMVRSILEADTGSAADEQRDRLCVLSGKDFLRLKDFIYGECGIKITEAKKPMLEARLQKRLRLLRLTSFSHYCDYLFSPRGQADEVTSMIDAVTTNKTDFFREPTHFEYLVRSVLPGLLKLDREKRTLFLWSAGCSSGEEPYTLAMVMEEFAKDHHEMDFVILATDISTKVLEKAKVAVYDEERIDPIPVDLRKRYLLRSKESRNRIYRIAPGLRQRVRFKRLNFMDSDFGFKEQMDIIFCRNVIIYFDRPTQERLLKKFCRFLSPYGYLFLGHSETLLGIEVPLAQVAPTVYRKIQ